MPFESISRYARRHNKARKQNAAAGAKLASATAPKSKETR
jgi:hypothetical protein